MLRLLALIISSISIVFLPFFFTPPALAADPIITVDEIKSFDDFDNYINQNNSLNKNLQEFCAKRQGGQMNLETWYSGKCPTEDDEFDTMSGEGVGFSDIVILDLTEKLIGQQDPEESFFDKLKSIKEALSQINKSPESQQLAIEDARQKLLYSYNSEGLIGQSGKLVALLFQNQPATTKSYLAYVTQNLQKHKIIPQALAASPGVGFNTFSPFLTIWIAVRNLAYLGLVVFFIVYGFMMMFRVNLGQKTVISVQLAIPKLIITLLVITFSYAIVGLIYDLMWVLIYFIFGYLESQKITAVLNIGEAKFSLSTLASGNSIFGMIGSFALNALVAGPAIIFGVFNLILGGALGAIATFASLILGIGWIVWIIVYIAVIISYAKLIFKLISAFISVIISLITGPIVLLGNAFPGSQAIGNWTRSIVANLSVFPITMLFLLFSYLLMVQPQLGLCSKFEGDFRTFFNISNDSGNMTFCENVYGVKNLVDGDSGIYAIPLIKPEGIVDLGFNAQGLLALLGVGLLLMSAKYVDMVKDALKVPPFKYGSAIGDALKLGVEGNEAWAKKGYPGIPGGLRTNKNLTGIADIYGGADSTNRPVLKGTDFNVSDAAKKMKGS